MSDFEKLKLETMLQEYTETFKAKAEAQQEKNDVKAKELHEKLEKIDGDISEQVKGLQEKQREQSDRLSFLEQKGVNGGPVGSLTPKTVGEMFIESDQYKEIVGSRKTESGKVEVGSFHPQLSAAAITNATGQNQPLVPDMRVPGIVKPAVRRRRVRSLLPVGPTQSNLIQFAKENVFTNAAAPQYLASPGGTDQFENVDKAESSLTFTLSNEPVQTIAHWIPASRQILDDAPMLSSYINTRLLEGLELEEEDQLLLGDNTGANLNGLVTQATAYDATLDVANDTKIDKLRHAILQTALSEYMATGIVLHPSEWHDIELVKVNAGTDDRYVWANPAMQASEQIWGLPVVSTTAMTNGDFLVGAFALAAQIWDRMQSTVEVSREHSDFFIKNMVAILAEERIALTVYRPAALITGTF